MENEKNKDKTNNATINNLNETDEFNKVAEIFLKKLKNIQKINLLFVCAGNICRSPYAEYLMRKWVNESKYLKGKVKCASAALQFKNEKIHPNTKKLLLEEGLSEEEIDAHVPRHISEHIDLFEKADLIIGMERAHKYSTPKTYRNKFRQISELSINKRKNIEDPYFAETFDEYKRVIMELKEFLSAFKQKLENFIKDNASF